MACSKNLLWFFKYSSAASESNGSFGFWSFINEHILNNTLLIVSAGLHCSFKMSKQIDPAELILGWYILVSNVIFGGLNG